MKTITIALLSFSVLALTYKYKEIARNVKELKHTVNLLCARQTTASKPACEITKEGN